VIGSVTNFWSLGTDVINTPSALGDLAHSLRKKEALFSFFKRSEGCADFC
jgi:hypothetical protein